MTEARATFRDEDLQRLAGGSAGFVEEIGASVLIRAGALCVEVPITAALLDTRGAVHPGVYATLIETAASVVAALSRQDGRAVVGLTNDTRALAPVTAGRLVAVAAPVALQEDQQLWRVEVHADDGTHAATGTVLMAVLEPTSPLNS